MFEFDEYYYIGEVTDTKEDALKVRRELDFGEDTELQSKYDNLPENLKEVVNHVVNELTSEHDNFGYNFTNFLAAMEDTDAHVDIDKIANGLFIEKDYYLSKKVESIMRQTFEEIYKRKYVDNEDIPFEFDDIKYEEMEDEFRDHSLPVIKDKLLATLRRPFLTDNTTNEEQQISSDNLPDLMGKEYADKIFKTVSSSELIRILCDCFLVDVDLLKYGVGRIYEIHNYYFQDLMDVLENGDEDNDFIKYLYSTPAYTTKEIAEEFEKYIIKTNGELPDGVPVLTEKWAVMTKSGQYLLCKKNANRSLVAKEKIAAINSLINDLSKL